jgi:signal transduction histidine kinase
MRAIRSGIAVCVLLCFACPTALAEQPLQRSILLIDPANFRGPFYYTIFFGLRSVVNERFGSPVTIYTESLDFSRFSGRDYEESLQAHFRTKYRDRPIGVLVAIGSEALDYVLRNRVALWPGVPIVFAMVDEATLLQLKPPPDVTGNLMKLRFEDMMASARAVVPGLERVVIVGDPLGQTLWRYFIEEIPAAAADVEVIDLTGLPMKELRSRVAALPDRTAILYTGIYSDNAGTYFPPSDAVALLAEVANRPIVVTAETFLDRGAVGGFVLTPFAIGEEAAGLASRILDGEAAANIPVTTGNVVRPIFDWRQLRRWNVSEARLPPGSEIRFRSPSAWEQYRVQILAILAVLLLQAASIASLLLERRRRHRSEAAAHELSARLINAQEEERARLARELHDDVTQRLALLAIEAGREEHGLPAAAGSNAKRALREDLVKLSEDVHALSYRLHPSILEDLGLAEALKAECETFAQHETARVAVKAAEILDALPGDVSLSLFRVAQEALRNVSRHARANRVEVTLERLDGGLQLAVRDDGAGFDPVDHNGRPSLGHASMRQRIRLVGGKLDVDSAPGHGTTVLAWVPLRESRSEARARPAG